MEVNKEKDEPPSSDKCRCCFQDGELMELWSEYVLDDGVINYGQELVECFSLALHQPADVVEKICVTCIGRLQDASTFKKLVLESDKRLLEQYFQGETVKVEDDAEYSQENNEHGNSDDDIKRGKPEYLELELLEAAGSNEPVNTIGPVVKRRKKERTTYYKQYLPENLEKCVKAVKLEVMTRSEAATFFNVPYKTIDGRLRAEKNEEVIVKDDISKEKYKGFLQEIKDILKYTNATPYRSKIDRYRCAYCCLFIDDPDVLRSHTRSVHAAERFSGVDVFMKANYRNEIIKIDILDLQCIICPAPIESWNDMFMHLKDIHNVELDEAYTKVIPYKLIEPLKCALCEERCDLYTILDSHMNCHYTNYMCGDCGDTFLAEARLKRHLEIHRTKKLKCQLCPKSFTLEKYRKKHVVYVHQQGISYKCRYCNEEFVNELRRHQHMEKEHSEKITPISCEHCKKTFTYRKYYMNHVRLLHNKKDKKKHKCLQCDKEFSMKYEFRKHEEWHLGQNKQTCNVCNKTFSSKQYLEKHYGKVHNDAKLLALDTGQS